MAVKYSYHAVVIGCSWGGLDALVKLLGKLPDDFPIPIVVVQHQYRTSRSSLANLLNDKVAITVCEAADKQVLVAAHVYIAPPNYHVLVEADGSLSLCVSEPICYSRPSVDVLFESAAWVFGKNLIGVVLTGANEDGSQGLKRIKQLGGLAMVQDPSTAESEVMPMQAIATTEVDCVLDLAGIAAELISRVTLVNKVTGERHV